jgi:hypothetical protein
VGDILRRVELLVRCDQTKRLLVEYPARRRMKRSVEVSRRSDWLRQG